MGATGSQYLQPCRVQVVGTPTITLRPEPQPLFSTTVLKRDAAYRPPSVLTALLMQHVDANRGAVQKQVYIMYLFWKPASSLSLRCLACSLVSAHSVSEAVVPPTQLFSCCRSCDALQSLSGEQPVYLRPSRPWNSHTQALLCLNWWNVLMRFWVCVCVRCILASFHCDAAHEHLAGWMSTYWISLDPTALVSRNIYSGVRSLPGLSLDVLELLYMLKSLQNHDEEQIRRARENVELIRFISGFLSRQWQQ